MKEPTGQRATIRCLMVILGAIYLIVGYFLLPHFSQMEVSVGLYIGASLGMFFTVAFVLRYFLTLPKLMVSLVVFTVVDCIQGIPVGIATLVSVHTAMCALIAVGLFNITAPMFSQESDE